MTPAQRSYIKKSILIIAIIAIYLFLTSTIIQYRKETRTMAYLYEFVKDWRAKPATRAEKYIAKEKALVTGVDEKLSERLSGYILLQVENKGEAWYVRPNDQKKYYLGGSEDMITALREFGRKIAYTDISSYQKNGFPESLAGQILVDVENFNDVYYIYPKNLRAYYIATDKEAKQTVKDLGMGVKNEDIRKIEVGEIK